MSKKTKRKSRDRPTNSATVALSPMDLWQNVLSAGYTPLYDCPEVRMCVNAYADMISNMTIYLMQNTANGDVRLTNELSKKIDINPCEHMTRKSWVWNIVNIMLTEGDGNCVVYPEYTANGYIENLRPLEPSKVQFVETSTGYAIIYNGKTLNPDEVIHFKMNPNPEKPYIGMGFRVSLREIVRSIRQANSTKDSLIASPTPSLIVSIDGLDDDMQTAEGRDKIADKYLAQTESGRPWIIPSEFMKIEQVKPLTLTDLAIKDNIELDKRTIAGIMGVPTYVVGIGAYNEDEQQNFINTKLLGLAQYIQQELTAKLLYSTSMYFKFNPRSLYNYKISEIISAGGQMVDRMAMRRNEWRDWMGLSPDEDMIDLLALENYIPADRLGDQKKLNGKEDES